MPPAQADAMMRWAQEPVAWRIRLAGDDPDEWTLHHNAVDYLDRPAFECQPLYALPADASAALEARQVQDRLISERYAQYQRAKKAEAERSAALAELAMAFEVAAQFLIQSGIAGDAADDPLASCIRSLTPADAQAALASRDREMRIAGYRVAQAEAARLGAHIVAPEYCDALTTPENGGGNG